jgi:hypothetical protein
MRFEETEQNIWVGEKDLNELDAASVDLPGEGSAR